MRLVALACVIAALSTSVAGASTAGKWTSHRSSAGFTIATPSTWVDMTRLTPQVLAKAKTEPSLQQYVDLIQRSKAIKLLVVDAGVTSIENHYAANLNVVQAATIGDLKLVRDENVAQLESAGVVRGALHASYVTLPAGKSARLAYVAKFSPTAPVVAVEQFVFVRAGKATFLTYTTLPKLRNTYAPTFAQSAHSLRFR
ncbi:MAG: hypothetical protein ACTHKS_04010 [Gaiellaceae bacterium]